jgi:hypothetical protein
MDIDMKWGTWARSMDIGMQHGLRNAAWIDMDIDVDTDKNKTWTRHGHGLLLDRRGL